MYAAQCKFLIQFSKQLIPDARPQSRGAMRPSLANRSPRKKRAQGMPGAQCTRSLACEINKAHERSHHGHTGNHPAFPAQWF
jgi:hypothetical protein